MNNFQELEFDDDERFKKSMSPAKKNIEGTIGSLKFIANIVEVYLPKIGDLLIAIAGGGKENTASPNNTPPNLQNFDSGRDQQ